VVGIGDDADGLGDGAAGEANRLVAVGADVAGAAEVVLRLANPTGMAQPATRETTSAMAKVRTSNRCRPPPNSQRHAR
jgi:hypothetical protein